MKALYIASCHLAQTNPSYYNPIVDVKGKCLYRNGEYAIYKHCEKAYYLLWKNIIIGEYTGICKGIVDALATGDYNKEKGVMRFNVKHCMEGKDEAETWAMKYNFEIK